MSSMKRTDSQIHKDLINELRWDTRVDETHVGIQVACGIVTLVGTVPTWAEIVAGVKAAHRVAGVLDVVNDLRVQGIEETTDTDLAEAVRHALKWDVRLRESPNPRRISANAVASNNGNFRRVEGTRASPRADAG